MNPTPTRRRVLAATGALATFGIGGCLGSSGDGGADGSGRLGDPAATVSIDMTSVPTPNIDPGIVHIEPGGTVEWRGNGVRNAVAAYHPETHGPLRMPEAGDPWVSEMIYEGNSYTVTLEEPGVYDYADTVVLCGSHESLGIVGRIVVGQPDLDAQPALDHDPAELPGKATDRMREFDDRCRDVLGND